MLFGFNRNILIWKLILGGSPAGLCYFQFVFLMSLYIRVCMNDFFFYGYINSYTLPALGAKSLIWEEFIANIKS